MSVAVCRAMPMPTPPRQRLDIWNAIHNDDAKPSYVVRRSMSLHLCTESLGCETGSLDFLDQASMTWPSPAHAHAQPDSFLPALEEPDDDTPQTGELTAVRYHRSRPQRAFPPPLPSMSRRDGPCLQMRPHRRDGRLVVEAVPVRPHGYFHSQRQGGRLRLCFVDCSVRDQMQSTVQEAELLAQQVAVVEMEHEDEEEYNVEDEEEEVEVVDRGTVVEVVAASGKAQRSRIVINKFVGGAPVSDQQPSRCVVEEEEAAPAAPSPGLRRVPSSTTTLAAAVAAASTTGMSDEEDDVQAEAETKKMLLFTWRVGDREELVQSVRRCRQLRQKPLFIVEPYCIAATS